jgi:hypothetical protein
MYFGWTAFVIMLCALYAGTFPAHAAEPVSDLLVEEIDLTDILSDVPSDIDPRSANARDLHALPYVSEEVAHQFTAYRDALPTGSDIADHLDLIDGLPPLARLILAVAIERAESTQPKTLTGTVGGSFRSGYRLRYDRTDPLDGALYSRTMLSHESSFDATFITERDALEPKMLDLVSGSALLRTFGGAANVVLGDYRVGYGQGLVLSRYGKRYLGGTDVGRDESDRVVNTSFEETRYMRGMHLALDHGPGRATAWISRRELDATLADDGSVLTIREDGLHESGDTSEPLSETVGGIRLAVERSELFAFGVTGMTTGYDPPLADRQGEGYLTAPHGDRLSHGSLDGSLTMGESRAWFEHARMSGGEAATVAGVSTGGGRVRTAVLGRRYDDGYRSFRSGGVASFGETANEEGMYLAVDARLTGTLRSTVGTDIARTLNRTASSVLPRQRKRFFCRVSGTLPHGVRGSGSLRLSADDGADPRWYARATVERSRKTGLATFWRLLAGLSGRGDGAGPVGEATLGLVYGKTACTLVGAGFDIPGYDARYYRYERDVPGRGYTRAVWGRGGSAIVMIRCPWISLRWAYTDSDDMKTVSEATIQFDRRW